MAAKNRLRPGPEVIEDHRQTAHKLEVVPDYQYLWAVILAQAGQGKPRQDYFLVDLHGGTGKYVSRERGWIPGTVPMACSVARYAKLKVRTAEIRVRAVERDFAKAGVLMDNVAGFRTAGVDVQVTNNDWQKVIEQIAGEIDAYQAPALWLVDPYGIDIGYDDLAPIRRYRWGQEVIINLDAAGALRVTAAALATPDGPAEIRDVIFGPHRHQTALGQLWGNRDWFDVVRQEGRTTAQKLDDFAAAYAARWNSAYKITKPYRLRSSHNQVRYLIHLTNSEFGDRKFGGVFKSHEDFGLLVSDRMDDTAAHHAACEYHERYRGSTTTINQLYTEAHRSHSRRELRRIAAAAGISGLGVYDPEAGTIRWYAEARDLDELDFSQGAN